MGSPRRITDEQRAQVEAMIADGTSHREIADTLGIGRRWINENYPGTGWDYRSAGAFGRMVRDTNAKIGQR